jgi:predicted phosphodiesterase
MRFALVSDIHANRQAWDAVLRDIRRSKVDSILCLGDVVGYGPMPDAVLESVCAEADELVIGNHDAVIGGRLEEDIFSDEARRVIDWTRNLLDDSARDLLSTLPAIVEGEGFVMAHGEVFDPERFGYIENQAEAQENFDADPTPLIFVGHTHYPGIFALDGQSGMIRTIVANDFALQSGVRYIVNVGSVGDPRDGGVDASYCIFDDRTGQIFFRRVSFDLEAYRADLQARRLDITPTFLKQVRPGAQAPMEDGSMQTMAPPRKRAKPPAKVIRMRHLEHGMTGEEQAAAADAHARRQQLAEALKRARLEEEERERAQADARAELLLRKQAAAETARRQRSAAEQVAAELARQRKIELARAADARMQEKERERLEAKARTEMLLRMKRETALQKKKTDDQGREQRPPAPVSPQKPAPGKTANVKPNGVTGSVLMLAPPSLIQSKPKVTLELAEDHEEALPVQATVASEEDMARDRRLALAKAAEEKKQKRIEEYRQKTELVRQAIQRKAEAARRARESSEQGAAAATDNPPGET